MTNRKTRKQMDQLMTKKRPRDYTTSDNNLDRELRCRLHQRDPNGTLCFLRGPHSKTLQSVKELMAGTCRLSPAEIFRVLVKLPATLLAIHLTKVEFDLEEYLSDLLSKWESRKGGWECGDFDDSRSSVYSDWGYKRCNYLFGGMFENIFEIMEVESSSGRIEIRERNGLNGDGIELMKLYFNILRQKTELWWNFWSCGVVSSVMNHGYSEIASNIIPSDHLTPFIDFLKTCIPGFSIDWVKTYPVMFKTISRFMKSKMIFDTLTKYPLANYHSIPDTLRGYWVFWDESEIQHVSEIWIDVLESVLKTHPYMISISWESTAYIWGRQVLDRNVPLPKESKLRLNRLMEKYPYLLYSLGEDYLLNPEWLIAAFPDILKIAPNISSSTEEEISFETIFKTFKVLIEIQQEHPYVPWVGPILRLIYDNCSRGLVTTTRHVRMRTWWYGHYPTMFRGETECNLFYDISRSIITHRDHVQIIGIEPVETLLYRFPMFNPKRFEKISIWNALEVLPYLFARTELIIPITSKTTFEDLLNTFPPILSKIVYSFGGVDLFNLNLKIMDSVKHRFATSHFPSFEGMRSKQYLPGADFYDIIVSIDSKSKLSTVPIGSRWKLAYSVKKDF